MTPNEAAAQQSADQLDASVYAHQRPTWSAPTVIRLDVTRSLAGSSTGPDNMAGATTGGIPGGA